MLPSSSSTTTHGSVRKEKGIINHLSALQFDTLLDDPQLFNQSTSPNQLFTYRFHPTRTHMTTGLDLSSIKKTRRFIQEREELGGQILEMRSLISLQVISISTSIDSATNENNEQSWKKRLDAYTRHSTKFKHNIPLIGYYERQSDGGMTRTLYMASIPFVGEERFESQNHIIDLIQNWYLFKYSNHSNNNGTRGITSSSSSSSGSGRGSSTCSRVKSVEELLESDSDIFSDLNSIVKLFTSVANGLSELHTLNLTHNSILPRNIIVLFNSQPQNDDKQRGGIEFIMTLPSFGLDNNIEGVNDDHIAYFSPQVFSNHQTCVESQVNEIFTSHNDVHMFGTLMMRILLGEEFDAKQIDSEHWEDEIEHYIKLIHSRLGSIVASNHTIEILSDLTCQCISPSEEKRPNIVEIVEILNSLLERPRSSLIKKEEAIIINDDEYKEEMDDNVDFKRQHSSNLREELKQSNIVLEDSMISSSPLAPPMGSFEKREVSISQRNAITTTSQSKIVPNNVQPPSSTTHIHVHSPTLAIVNEEEKKQENNTKDYNSDNSNDLPRTGSKKQQPLERPSMKFYESDQVGQNGIPFSSKSKMSFSLDCGFFSLLLGGLFGGGGSVNPSFNDIQVTENNTSIQPLVCVLHDDPKDDNSKDDDSLQKKERYLVQKRLSDGASAIILQVKDNESGSIHVMKRFREGVESDYIREVSSLQLFSSHKNIVQYVDHFSYTENVDGKSVKSNLVIMEYCHFGDLFKMSMSFTIGGKPKLMRPLRMLKFTLQLFEAIAHIHQFGYVHSDIKPQNIFISKDGNLKLGDFGFTVKENENVVGGTLHYLPPEQEEGQPSILSSDLYSAACSMFEVLIKKKVNLKSKQGTPITFEQVWDQHNKNNIHFHRKKYNPHAIGLFDIFKNCLETDHKKRKTAREIVETLRCLLQNHSATMVQKRYRGYQIRKIHKK